MEHEVRIVQLFWCAKFRGAGQPNERAVPGRVEWGKVYFALTVHPYKYRNTKTCLFSIIRAVQHQTTSNVDSVS